MSPGRYFFNFFKAHKKMMAANAFSVSSSVARFSPSQCLHRQRFASIQWLYLTKSHFLNPRKCSSSICNKGRKLSFSLKAQVGENAGPKQVPKSVPPTAAFELQQAGHKYLDVRTPEEFSAGHAVGAVNVPYLLRHESGGMVKNGSFLEEVSSYFRSDDQIIVGCQLGKRSLMAATDLLSQGFTGVTDIAGGYAAWTQNGLPIES